MSYSMHSGRETDASCPEDWEPVWGTLGQGGWGGEPEAPAIKILMDTEGPHSVPVTALQVLPSLK